MFNLKTAYSCIFGKKEILELSSQSEARYFNVKISLMKHTNSQQKAPYLGEVYEVCVPIAS